MSRFFAAGYASDSLSEEEDLLLSEEELIESTDLEFANDDESSSDDDDDYGAQGPAYFFKSSFLKNASDSQDEDQEGRRVVRSAREKLLADLQEGCDAVGKAKATDDWVRVLTDFDRVGRLLVRAAQQNVAIPNFYYKMLGEMDRTLVVSSGNRKKLPADQSRALNTMRQRVKKQTKEFAQYMAHYAEHPEAFDLEEPVDFGHSAGVQTQEQGPAASPIFTALKLIAETRGKKNIDKHEQVATLEKLLEDAQLGLVFEQISVFQMLLSVRFDAALGQPNMLVAQWAAAERDLCAFLSLLEQQMGSFRVCENGVRTDDLDIEPAPNADGVRVMLGLVAALVERLDDEFVRLLQNADPHLTEYIDRLKDEPRLYRLLVRAQVYVAATTGAGEHMARTVLRRLEHIYYKPNFLIRLAEEAAWKDLAVPDNVQGPEGEPEQVVAALTGFLLQQESSLYRQHATLLMVYHHAVNGQYAAAREVYLELKLHNGTATMDSLLQVLFNRALVQLGLAAFKCGEIEQAHVILSDIVGLSRLKELLGQGFTAKYASQVTVAERAKLLPFHVHINLELLECVYTTLLMLIEIPALAALTLARDARRKAPVRLFKSKLEFHERQFFTGPPESIKDHLTYASRYLRRGAWAKAYDLLLLIKIWKLLPNHTELLAMLRHQLQVEGLRTYIFTYRLIFTNLSVAKLSQSFDLAPDAVQDIVGKIFALGEVSGLVDANYVNFALDAPQRSKLQELAIVMNEKVGLLKEKNDKTLLNGFGRKLNAPKESKEREQAHEDTRFRYANVNTNNDEFQVKA